jgi:ABC-type nitrate/sulfonate/bicarbonate transport system permease component
MIRAIAEFVIGVVIALPIGFLITNADILEKLLK